MSRFSSLARSGLVRPLTLSSIHIPTSHPFSSAPRQVPVPLFHSFVTRSFTSFPKSKSPSTWTRPRPHPHPHPHPHPSTSAKTSTSTSSSSSSWASSLPWGSGLPPDPPSNTQSSEEDKRDQRNRWIGIVVLLLSSTWIFFRFSDWLIAGATQEKLKKRQQQLKLEPLSLEEVDELLQDSTAVDQHRRVHVRGKLLYDKTIRVEYDKNYPRESVSPVLEIYKNNPSHLISPIIGKRIGEVDIGYLLFTPMILEDGRIVIINRGREENYQQQHDTTHASNSGIYTSADPVELVGVIELGESRHLYIGEEERARDQIYGLVRLPVVYKKCGIVLEPNQRPILIDALDMAKASATNDVSSPSTSDMTSASVPRTDDDVMSDVNEPVAAVAEPFPITSEPELVSEPAPTATAATKQHQSQSPNKLKIRFNMQIQ